MLNRTFLLLIQFFLFQICVTQAEDLKKLVDLKGYWSFSIGDDLKWSAENYDDQHWDRIFVPERWENEGYDGYNGFAWYRKKFRLRVHAENSIYYILLGLIDDVDEVYVNGQLIGSSGSFPPNSLTASEITRRYHIPPGILHFDKENTIAVRVYDMYLDGGITHGEIGVFTDQDQELIEKNLAGIWKFRIHDLSAWKSPEYQDENWSEIHVPSNWESSGYTNYDGFAWYRKSFYLPLSFKEKELVLILGRIDDSDQTYVNGAFVGSSARLKNRYETGQMEHRIFRAYSLNKDILKFGHTNLIAVRVYDSRLGGGIYEGPVGITTREKAEILIEKYSETETIWDVILRSIFDY